MISASVINGPRMRPPMDLSQCRVASWIIKFSSEATVGTQNLLQCTTGDPATNEPGASPKFPSEDVANCDILRAGVPEWTQSLTTFDNGIQNPEEYETKNLCFAPVADQTGTVTPGGVLSPTLEHVCPFGTEFAFHMSAMLANYELEKTVDVLTENGTSITSLNSINLDAAAADQSAQLVSYEASGSSITQDYGHDSERLMGLKYPNEAVYLVEQVNSVLFASYPEATPCGNHGTCDSKTGLCQCESGFTGESCGSTVGYS